LQNRHRRLPSKRQVEFASCYCELLAIRVFGWLWLPRSGAGLENPRIPTLGTAV
jgi:hypothetical protein